MLEKATIARPYARAAFEQAHASGALKPWSDMLAFLAAAVSDPVMRKALHHPRLDPAALAAILIEIGGALIVKDGGNFIRLLAGADRLPVAPEIHEQFELKRALAESVADVNITAAFELDDAHRDRLAQLIEKRLKRRVRVTTGVDPSIIGGVIIQSGDSVVDASVRGRLRQLSNEFAS